MVLPPLTAPLPWGSGPGISCNTLPPCLGQWAVVLLRHTAPRPGGSGQWTSCNALPHCLGAVGSGTPAMYYLTALGQWAVELLQCTASLPGGSGQCNLCNALPHCPWSVLCCAVSCFAVLWGVLRCVVCCAVLVPRELWLGYGLVFELEGLRGGECWFALCAGLRAG